MQTVTKPLSPGLGASRGSPASPVTAGHAWAPTRGLPRVGLGCPGRDFLCQRVSSSARAQWAGGCVPQQACRPGLWAPPGWPGPPSLGVAQCGHSLASRRGQARCVNAGHSAAVPCVPGSSEGLPAGGGLPRAFRDGGLGRRRPQASRPHGRARAQTARLCGLPQPHAQLRDGVVARTASRLLQGLGAAAPGTRSAAGLCSCEPVFTHPAAVGVAWAGQPLGKEVWLRRARPALCAAGHATGCAD